MSLNGKAILPEEELQGSVEPIREVRGKLTGLEFIQGHSAYEVAVINGFVGTEEEWLASLKGESWTDADRAVLVTATNSASEAAESANNAVTELRLAAENGEFNGQDGKPGVDGAAGIGIKSITIQEVT